MGLFSLWDKKGRLKEQEKAFKTEKINEYKIAFREIVANKREDSLQLFDTTKVDGKNYLLEMLQYDYTAEQTGRMAEIERSGKLGSRDYQYSAIKVFDLLSGQPVLLLESLKNKGRDESVWSKEKEAAFWRQGMKAEIKAYSENNGWDIWADRGNLYTRVDGGRKTAVFQQQTADWIDKLVVKNPQARELYVRGQHESAAVRQARASQQNTR